MPTFNNPKDLAAHLKKALDQTLQSAIVSTQQGLGSAAVSPKDTGRLLSSWFAKEGSPSNEVAPEGSDSPSTDATGLKVDSSKAYHLTNNLPYAQSAAIEGRVLSQPSNWFHDYVNVRIPKNMEEAALKAKRDFEL